MHDILDVIWIGGPNRSKGGPLMTCATSRRRLGQDVPIHYEVVYPNRVVLRSLLIRLKHRRKDSRVLKSQLGRLGTCKLRAEEDEKRDRIRPL